MITETSTGIAVNLVDPQPEMFCIEDIAWSLGMQCRYNGHTKWFYSVAQHCVNVAHCMLRDERTPKQALDGLLHDAHEAYLGDIISPVKRIDGIHQPLDWAAKRIDDAIYEALGHAIPNQETAELVKQMDMSMLMTEARDLMKSGGSWWGIHDHPRQDMVIDRGWMPDEAGRRFYELYERLVAQL